MSSLNPVDSTSESTSSSSSATPSASVKSLPSSTTTNFLFPFRSRSRGQSASALREPSPSPPVKLSPLSRVISAPPESPANDNRSWFGRPRPHSNSLTPPTLGKRLSLPGIEPEETLIPGSVTPPHGVPTSWWNRVEISPRGWKDSPRRKKTVPSEQTEAWLHTRDRVREAVVSVLGNAGDIAHEALAVSVDVLRFAPLVGLSEAARTLLNIWDSLQKVDMNRMACLRLTERCANILLSVREEIAEAGDGVIDELKHPVAKLVESFTDVHNFLQKLNHRPFLKRYLKRDEILVQIALCDTSLNDSVGLFSLSIQIRILKQVQQAELRRQADADALRKATQRPDVLPEHGGSLLLSTEPEELSVPLSVPFSAPNESTSPALDATVLTSKDPFYIRATLHALHAHQNEIDQVRDMADLRGLMRMALQAGNDSDMLDVLQVGRDEMPEAIKALQRALERQVEKEAISDGVPASPSVSAPTMVKRINVKEVTIPVTVPAGTDEHGVSMIRGPSRGETILSIASVSTTSSSCSSWPRDTLDREFMESGIDALRRLSNTNSLDLPSWTITRYEVDREEKIGVGFFSKVYRGTWRDRIVAIKVLACTTPRKLFVREVGIWKSLRHPNVLELYGASAASDEGPWFFVCPYLRNGSLVSYLKSRTGSKSREQSRTRTSKVAAVVSHNTGLGVKETDSKGEDVDMLKMMYEIARGMQYLHGKGVLHGDLKGANVLIDDKIRCVISDFGQSELKSEVYRISGAVPPHGTLRWQSPELLAGHALTTEADIYAFAICCIEILGMGNLPWSQLDDSTVIQMVLRENQRPGIPRTRVTSTALQDLLRLCWHQDPFMRPSFSKIVWDIKQLRVKSGRTPFIEEAVSPRVTPDHPRRPSPDMRPILLPTSPVSPSSDAYLTAEEDKTLSPINNIYIPRPGVVNTTHPVMFTPSLNASRASSMSSPTGSASDEGIVRIDYGGYESPPPATERLADMRNERRYRLLLTHEYHPSLILPLWSPTPVFVGAVGYLSKPTGTFTTLFNAFDPTTSSSGVIQGMATLHGFGQVQEGSQRQEKRTIAQKGLDAISGFLTFKNKGDGSLSQHVIRRYSYPLRNGHRCAYLCTETTVYRYIQNLDAPKQWFKANIDAILRTYGMQHAIQKEDVSLVIGTLDAPDHALFVSHQHPDGQVHFNVFSSAKSGQDWGMFTTDTAVAIGGPSYQEEFLEDARICASKVSKVGGPQNTVLLARLRFKPDILEPTSL